MGGILAATASVCITGVVQKNNLLVVNLSFKIVNEVVVPELPFVVA